jgi:hypothetical protein
MLAVWTERNLISLRPNRRVHFKALCTINISLLWSFNPILRSRDVETGDLCENRKVINWTPQVTDLSRRGRNDHRLNSQQLRKIFRIDRFDLAGVAHALNQLVGRNETVADGLDRPQRQVRSGVQQIFD